MAFSAAILKANLQELAIQTRYNPIEIATRPRSELPVNGVHVLIGVAFLVVVMPVFLTLRIWWNAIVGTLRFWVRYPLHVASIFTKPDFGSAEVDW